MFRDFSELLEDAIWPIAFTLLLWLSFLFNLGYDLDWNAWGIQPRSALGALGIITSPFLHGNFDHIFSNSLPFLVSGILLFHFYPQSQWKIFFLIWFFSGFGVWLYGRPMTNHIGASGLVYGLVSFIIFSGLFKKNRKLMAAGLILLFLYGSMVWGIFPQIHYNPFTRISWEGHLSGLLSGIALAWIYRMEGPQNPQYFPNEEDEDDDPDNAWWKEDVTDPVPSEMDPEKSNSVFPPAPEIKPHNHEIKYHYIKKEGNH